MGDVVHRDVIITLHETDNDLDAWKWLEDFRSHLPDPFKFKLTGPHYMNNGYQRWFFISSGSNDGWPTNKDHEKYCEELLQHFKHRALMVVHGDGRVPEVKSHTWELKPA